MITKMKILVLILGIIILFTGCSSGTEPSNDNCNHYSDDIINYENVLFNGNDGSSLYSTEPSSIIPDSMFYNEETNEILEFFNGGNVMKIIPDGDNTYVYGGTYTIDDENITLVFYSNNQVISEVNYSYILVEIESEIYYSTRELHLIDSDNNLSIYIQPQRIPRIDEGE